MFGSFDPGPPGPQYNVVVVVDVDVVEVGTVVGMAFSRSPVMRTGGFKSGRGHPVKAAAVTPRSSALTAFLVRPVMPTLCPTARSPRQIGGARRRLWAGRGDERM